MSNIEEREIREAEELARLADFQRTVKQARTINRTVGIVVLLILALLVGWNWPKPADASVRGKVDVCAVDVPKSWTRGLEKKANKAFAQRIDVKRRSEDRLGGCDVLVWVNGKRALNYLTGEPSPNPRYHVYTGAYAMADIEINVGSITPKKKRPATIIKALREGGVR